MLLVRKRKQKKTKETFKTLFKSRQLFFVQFVYQFYCNKSSHMTRQSEGRRFNLLLGVLRFLPSSSKSTRSELMVERPLVPAPARSTRISSEFPESSPSDLEAARQWVRFPVRSPQIFSEFSRVISIRTSSRKVFSSIPTFSRIFSRVPPTHVHQNWQSEGRRFNS